MRERTYFSSYERSVLAISLVSPFLQLLKPVILCILPSTRLLHVQFYYPSQYFVHITDATSYPYVLQSSQASCLAYPATARHVTSMLHQILR